MGPIRTLDGREVHVLPHALESLAASLRGDILTRNCAEYEPARAIWNAAIDRSPALIVRCAHAGDVQRIVRFAAQHNLLTAVRGGGQGIAGNAICDGGIVIDLTRMRRARVNVLAQTVVVDGGCTVADVDRATQAHGLATPLAASSATGVGGLTLGGGFGWLSRKYGMTIDSLISAEIVTANGDLLHVSESEHADLFWAVRGGGGNFGVVTRFEFALHHVGPDILAALIVFPLSESAAVWRSFREVVAHAPDDLSVWAVLRQAPPLYFLPAAQHGREVLILAACYCGTDHAAGEQLLAPLRSHPSVIGEMVGVMPYLNWQQTFDPLCAAGAYNYWKSHDLRQLQDALLPALQSQLLQLPAPDCEIVISHVGGTIRRVPPNRTAYPNRATRHILTVRSRWQHHILEDSCVRWARDTYRATAPFASGSVYLNYLAADERQRLSHAYGLNYARLISIKNRYDPHNFFRVNRNVRPDPALTEAAAVHR